MQSCSIKKTPIVKTIGVLNFKNLLYTILLPVGKH